MNWQTADPAPSLLVLPPAAASLDEAHAAIEQWEWYSGKVLDSSQRLTVEVMMAETAGGRWAARSTGREMPRQNGKGDELEVVEFWGLIQRGEAIVHSAHELQTVSSAHERLSNLLESHRDLRVRVTKNLNGLGQQMIAVRGGGVIAYRTRTKGGGRGLDDVSRLVIDEAQHAKPEQLASVTPILLANPNPQTNFVGTGAIDGESAWWWKLRRRALGESPGDFGYVGHTAEVVTLDADGKVRQERIDASDRDLWHSTNPALAAGRAEIEFFAEQYRNLGPELFAREHLCVWDPEPSPEEHSGPIPLERWAQLVDVSNPYDRSTVVLAVDVAFDRSWASIAAVGERPDGLIQGKIVASKPDTGWIPARVAELSADIGGSRPVVMSKGDPLIDKVTGAGVDVYEMPSTEQGTASQALIDACLGLSPRFRHHGEPALTEALRRAETRTSGDNVDWSRKLSPGDISPLKALSMAFGRVGADVPEPFFAY